MSIRKDFMQAVKALKNTIEVYERNGKIYRFMANGCEEELKSPTFKNIEELGDFEMNAPDGGKVYSLGCGWGDSILVLKTFPTWTEKGSIRILRYAWIDRMENGVKRLMQ